MTRTLTTRCCIAGGGPAGMMLGLLLARAGVPVVVLEKHADEMTERHMLAAQLNALIDWVLGVTE